VKKTDTGFMLPQNFLKVVSIFFAPDFFDTDFFKGDCDKNFLPGFSDTRVFSEGRKEISCSGQ